MIRRTKVMYRASCGQTLTFFKKLLTLNGVLVALLKINVTKDGNSLLLNRSPNLSKK